MIEFKQLGSGTPPDIEVTTDDAQAELAAMADAFTQFETDSGAEPYRASMNLADATMEDGKLTFVIPGNEVGEVADVIDDFSGQIPLQDFLEEMNTKALERAAGIDEASRGEEEAAPEAASG